MKVSRWCPLLSLTVVSLLCSAPTRANDDWWFDVEVILFERKLDLTTLDEQFEFADSLTPPLVEADVINDALAPSISWLKQGLPTCGDTPHPQWPDHAVTSEDTPLFDDGGTVDSAVAGDKKQQTGVGAVENNLSSQSAEQAIQQAAQQDIAQGTKEGAAQGTQQEISAEVNSTATRNTDTRVNGEYAIREELIAGDANDFVEQVPRNLAVELFLADSAVTQDIAVPEVSACETKHPWMTFQDGQLHTYEPDNRIPPPQEIPITPEGVDWPYASHAHLLPVASQQLTSLSRQIRQNRELTRLLHIAWRQPVSFGKNNAFNVRLFAGQNFADRFTLSGEPIVKPEASDDDVLPALGAQSDNANTAGNHFFEHLEQKLSAPAVVDFSYFSEPANSLENNDIEIIQQGPTLPIWQLDGNLKVFLKYINRVPYLHIDSELFYRQPIPLSALMPASEHPVKDDTLIQEAGQTEYRLVSVPFSEQRRVISKQLHYFDHPLFGMIVEIRRYHRPSPTQQ